MISINPTMTSNYSFQARKNKPDSSKAATDSTNKPKDNKKLYLTLAGLAATGAVAVIAGKQSITTYEQTLKKNGIEIKDGIAILSSTGEKYTGAIKRNVKAFGLKKETVQFDNGIISEKIYHNLQGNELEGEFYKDGVRRVRVTKDIGEDKRYERYIFTEDGKIKVRGQCHNRSKNKFNYARDLIKNL